MYKLVINVIVFLFAIVAIILALSQPIFEPEIPDVYQKFKCDLKMYVDHFTLGKQRFDYKTGDLNKLYPVGMALLIILVVSIFIELCLYIFTNLNIIRNSIGILCVLLSIILLVIFNVMPPSRVNCPVMNPNYDSSLVDALLNKNDPKDRIYKNGVWYSSLADYKVPEYLYPDYPINVTEYSIVLFVALGLYILVQLLFNKLIYNLFNIGLSNIKTKRFSRF